MRIKNLKRKLLHFGLAGAGVFFLFFVLTCRVIGSQVKENCQEAKKEYGGDCVEALIALLNDESESFRKRNSAIWALGQLGDRRALPILQSYYTGEIPRKGSLEGNISQYELKKAINLASGGLNLSALIWRRGD